jgi:hypothetical protein
VLAVELRRRAGPGRRPVAAPQHLAELLGFKPDPRACWPSGTGLFEVLVPGSRADGDRASVGGRRRVAGRERKLLVVGASRSAPGDTRRLGLGLGHPAPSPPSLETIVPANPRIARAPRRACGTFGGPRGLSSSTVPLRPTTDSMQRSVAGSAQVWSTSSPSPARVVEVTESPQEVDLDTASSCLPRPQPPTMARRSAARRSPRTAAPPSTVSGPTWGLAEAG